MSYYSHYPSSYGMPLPQSYSPPPPAHTGYHYSYPAQPPPPPPYLVDPVLFRREYSHRLAELTVNSRPIIQGLSVLAHDCVRFADIVAECLEMHIRRVPPWIKLPAFYLLDMISKNIYDPYARQFSAFIIPLFLESYNQVDEPTRKKMDELVITWRTGSPSGKELFGASVQRSIERGIWGDGASGSSFSGYISESQVLSELEFVLGQKERALQATPYDNATRNQVGILHQLKKLVESGVSQKELKQILGQLRTLSQTPTPVPTSAQAAPAPSTSLPQWIPGPAASSSSQVVAPAPQSFAQASAVPVTQFSSSAPPALPGNISDILSSLAKAGVISATGTPSNAGEPMKVDKKKDNSEDLAKDAARNYRQRILAQNVQLTTAGVTKTRPRIADLLYSQLPLHCKQCGIRYPDSELGKKSMEEHLDMHFRQNRKANQNSGRGHSRSWFVTLEDWVNDTSDPKGKGKARVNGSSSSKAAATEDTAKRDAELRTQFVVVPPGDEAKTISCPVCKEVLRSEWLEDDEDWVWKNAVKKDDKIYHATCHAEATTNVLAARLRGDLAKGNNSRGSTPESVARLSTPQLETRSGSPSPEKMLIGFKRKAEDELYPDAPHGQPESTPPSKKIALAA